MTIRQAISVGNLLLDVQNYRHGSLNGQKAALDAIIVDQGKKLTRLAEDIVDLGLNPTDLPLVIDAEDGNGNFVVIEGNRRLAAVKLMLEPALAEETAVHAAFKRLNKNRADAIPKVFECVIADSRAAGGVWINRKHMKGLEGAGTEQWESIARARAQRDQGERIPELDVIDFVLADNKLSLELRSQLTGSDFDITTLERLVTTKELQSALGLTMRDKRLESAESEGWLKPVLKELLTIIATGKHNGRKFTVRDIDSQDKREAFIRELVGNHPKPKRPVKAPKPWVVSGSPEPAKPPVKAKNNSQTTPTPTTDERPHLVPRKFKLELPSGKINDIFDELKKLDVVKHRHAVSVLFRVFLELTLAEYIKRRGISLPTDSKDRPVEGFKVRLSHVVKDVGASKLMTTDELKPINTAISDKHSLLAPDTMNSYVHSSLMNPDPLQLKVAWNNIQVFVERLWSVKN